MDNFEDYVTLMRSMDHPLKRHLRLPPRQPKTYYWSTKVALVNALQPWTAPKTVATPK